MSQPVGQPPEINPSADLSGRQLGAYRILRRLGRGAMAEVYLAEQTSLKRQIALKVLRRDVTSDERRSIQRFQFEAQAAAALVHANIVQIYEVGQHDGLHFIAQEFVRGQNLRQFLKRHGPADAPLAFAILRQAAAALTRAAEQGIVHRDIKPENIMLGASGDVKVADFGLALLTHGDKPVDLTQDGVTMGTPLYMSPEQAEGKPLDARSDIYSLGVTCYHLLTGRPPFEGDTALAVAVQHVKTEPERLENRRPDLPEGLCRVVHKMLAKAPDDRYQTPVELLRDLRSLDIAPLDDAWSDGLDHLSSVEMAAISTGRLEATTRLETVMHRAGRRRRSPRWPILLVGLLLVVTAAALAGWLAREPDLLSDAKPEATIEILDTVERQYRLALTIGWAEGAKAEQAWRAVIDHFPESPHHVAMAKQHLARLYLSEGRYEEAEELLDDLVALDETERQLRAFGLAGQLLIHDLRGETAQAASKLRELEPLQRDLDVSMQRAVAIVVPRLRRAVGEREMKAWQDFLSSQLTDDPSADSPVE